ncbi:unnamed protein product [Rhizophagus irregularis]|nr:unnamed protein product [Rhizophagus irregularis]CAB4412219.1 unnamed protein product [Rhizophagus irregularis]
MHHNFSTSKRKWFVQEHQLSNHSEVIHAYNYVGKEQAKRIADLHHPPRDQLAAVHDCGGEILDSAIKGVIISKNRSTKRILKSYTKSKVNF